MFAIVEIGGKQYKVKQKDIIRVEKLDAEGKNVTLSKVLLTSNGSKTSVGTPFIEGASVDLKVLKNGLNDKVYTFKMKAKKRYKRQKNHRQPYSEVEVVTITG